MTKIEKTDDEIIKDVNDFVSSYLTKYKGDLAILSSVLICNSIMHPYYMGVSISEIEECIKTQCELYFKQIKELGEMYHEK